MLLFFMAAYEIFYSDFKTKVGPVWVVLLYPAISALFYVGFLMMPSNQIMKSNNELKALKSIYI